MSEELETENLISEKRRLRREWKRLMKTLDENYCTSADQSICEQLFTLEAWRQARTVFCYVGAGREINTWPIIDHGLSEGKQIGVPLCTAPGIMEARQITGMDSLIPGHFGIREPRPDSPLMAEGTFDLVIVPGISFTMDGLRLGYGGGYYDRYLPRVPGLKVALCREKSLSLHLPVQPHDIRMDVIVTENSTYFLNHSEKV